MAGYLRRVAMVATAIALAGCGIVPGLPGGETPTPTAATSTQDMTNVTMRPTARTTSTSSPTPTKPVTSLATTRVGAIFREPLDSIVNDGGRTDPKTIDWKEVRAGCDYADPVLDGEWLQGLKDSESGREASAVIAFKSRELAKKAFSGLQRVFEGCTEQPFTGTSAAAEPAWVSIYTNGYTLAIVQYANIVAMVDVHRQLNAKQFAARFRARIDGLG